MRGSRAVQVLGLVCALAPALAGCGGHDRPLSGSVTGVVASGPQPLLHAWARRFERDSGARVRLRTGSPGAADFAFGDGAPPPASAHGELIAVPVARSEVAIVYNLVRFTGKRIPSGFKIDGHTLASIYKGPTFNWHQKVFLALNPGLDIPDELFQVCRHSGSWGPTATLTAFLARSGPNWAKDVGVGAHVPWPHLAAPSVETTDVPGCVRRASGSIGYALPIEARRAGLTTAAIEEAHGAFRQPGEPGYPIAGSLDLLVWRDACRAGRARQAAVNAKAWLAYLLGAGQALVRRNGYVPLAPAARARARAQLALLTCDGRPLTVPR